MLPKVSSFSSGNPRSPIPHLPSLDTHQAQAPLCSQSNPLQNPWEALEALDNRIWKARLAAASTVETIPTLPMISALYRLSIAW